MPASPTSRDADMSLYLHAELLPNIRHITLYISLPASLSSKDIDPQVSLSDSRRAVSVSLPKPFDDVADTIKLPARVNEASRHTLTTMRPGAGNTQNNSTCDNGRREYSFRMQIDNDGESRLSREELVDDFVPWIAADMSASTRLRCQRCENIILDIPGSLRDSSSTNDNMGWVWKDLPSGNWAEMMDFWHCHKPNSHDEDHNADGEERNAQVKGYGAANQVVATPGTVLVDVATFLVSDVDCKGLKKVMENSDETSPADQTNIQCEQCHTLIGTEDHIANGWRLFKTSLSASTPSIEDSSEPNWESHPTETIFAAQLLELIERENFRRFVIHCGNPDGLLIWVFNPDLRYSSSSITHSITARRAMKVFFQDVSNVDELLNPELGKTSSLALEELKLPSDVFDAVSQALVRSNEMLPVSARRFREWKVGVLNRFERSKSC